MSTHCLPNNILGTNELPIPNVTAANISISHATTGVGSRRGVIVVLHGLETQSYNPIPYTLSASLGAGFAPFTSILNADGWEIIQVPYQEDLSSLNPSLALYNDVNADTGHGSRYLASSMRWWDHVVDYIGDTYGTNWPIVVFGLSLGGIKTCNIAANRQSSITALMSHIPATIFEIVHPFISQFAGVDYGTISWAGLDVQTTIMNGVGAANAGQAGTTVKGMIGYGTSDIFIGYGSTTLGAGSAGIAVNSTNFNGSQTLAVNSTTNLVLGPRVLLTTSGGLGWAVLSFTGTLGGNTLTGVKYVGGSGTTVNGSPVQQGDIITTIANQNAAIPGNPIQASAQPESHLMSAADGGQSTTPTGLGGATALSAITSNLAIGSLTGGFGSLVSSKCAILASDGLWHIITFSGSDATHIGTTSISFSGNQAATVTNTSPICQIDYTAGAAYPYWLMTNVDPSCPKIL